MKNKKESSKFITVIIYIFIILVAVSLIYPAVTGTRDAFIYENTKDKAVEVTAVVSYHDSYTDSDDNTRYYSYIRYTFDGQEYKDIRYQSESRESSLLPVSTKLTISINPDDPAQPMENLRTNGFSGTLILSVLIAVICILAYTSYFSSSNPKLHNGMLTDEELHRCLMKRTAKYFNKSFFFGVLTVIHLIYLFLFPGIHKGLIFIINAVITVFFFVPAFRRTVYIIKRRYQKVRENITDKKIVKDTDNDGDEVTLYRIYAGTADHTWSSDHSINVYDSVNVGDYVKSVYSEAAKNKNMPEISYIISPGRATLFYNG